MKQNPRLPKQVSFGHYIRSLRITKGMGLREVARALSEKSAMSRVTHAYLSNIESGRKPAPRPRILSALASILSVSPIEMEMVAQGWTVIRAEDLLRQVPDQGPVLAQLEVGAATNRDVLRAITDSYEYTPLSLNISQCVIIDSSQGVFVGFRRRSSTSSSSKQTRRPRRSSRFSV